MRYVKPHYYDNFRCIADKCPDTCCAGWQIVIDDDALEKYSRVTGPFGNRLYTSIDWREGIFRQKKGRCSFLNDKNLCDLYKELGEGALCRTCSMYPRHVEEFDGLRELSLSLSCPVAAEMILTCKEPLVLLEEETDEEEELAEEFEDFDTLMFTQLEDARAVIFAVMQERTIPVKKRIQRVIDLAKNMQQCIDEERYYDVDEVIRQYQQNMQVSVADRHESENIAQNHAKNTGWNQDTGWESESRYDKMCREYQIFNKLERLREEWSDMLDQAWVILYQQGETSYQRLCKEFDRCFGFDSEYHEEWSLFTENLMLFFVYTYFCGAVYDDQVYSKIALAQFSVRWIQELIMATWIAQTRQMSDNEPPISVPPDIRNTFFDWHLCIETAYRYAREIEHSDDNLNILEDYLHQASPTGQPPL